MAVNRSVTLYNRNSTPVRYKLGDRVFVKRLAFPPGVCRKLASKWLGPFRIIRQFGDTTFRVKDCYGKREMIIHANHLKPASGYEFPQDSTLLKACSHLPGEGEEDVELEAADPDDPDPIAVSSGEQAPPEPLVSSDEVALSPPSRPPSGAYFDALAAGHTPAPTPRPDTPPPPPPPPPRRPAGAGQRLPPPIGPPRTINYDLRRVPRIDYNENARP